VGDLDKGVDESWPACEGVLVVLDAPYATQHVVRRARRGAEVVRLRKLVRDRNLESIFVRRPKVPRWRQILGTRPLADELLQRESGTRVGIHVSSADDG
jgi:hypothetical protein